MRFPTPPTTAACPPPVSAHPNPAAACRTRNLIPRPAPRVAPTPSGRANAPSFSRSLPVKPPVVESQPDGRSSTAGRPRTPTSCCPTANEPAATGCWPNRTTDRIGVRGIDWHRRNKLTRRPAPGGRAGDKAATPAPALGRGRQCRAEMDAARAARREPHHAAQQVAAEIAARAARKRASAEEAERQPRAELVARVRGHR
jgi:hypothetical protein